MPSDRSAHGGAGAMWHPSRVRPVARGDSDARAPGRPARQRRDHGRGVREQESTSCSAGCELSDARPADATVVAIFLLIAFPVHEFSHAWVAYRLGDSTARYQGRLSLNPDRPLRSARRHDAGDQHPACWASASAGPKPTPVNPYNLRYGRRGEALVAVAGPISNLVMAVVVAIPLRFIWPTPACGHTVCNNDIALVRLESWPSSSL